MVSFPRYSALFISLQLFTMAVAQNVPWATPSVSLVSAPLVVDCIPRVDGRNLSEGDYIGIFNEAGNCYGLSRWKDTSVFRITIYGSDGVTDGFRAGDRLNLRIWIRSENCSLDRISQVSSDQPLVFSAANTTRIQVLDFERASVSYPVEECCLNGPALKPVLNYSVPDLVYSSVSGLNLDPGTGIIAPSRSDPGNYSVSLVSKTCLAGRTLLLTLNDYPRLESMPDTFICGERLTITAPVSQELIQWSTGATTRAVDFTQTTTAWYRATNQKGCSNADTFSVKKMEIARLDYLVTEADCHRKGRIDILGQEILNGKGPYSYKLTSELDNFETTDLAGVAEGIYRVDVINANGCVLRYNQKVTVSKECLDDRPVFSPNEDGLDDRYFINLEGRIEIFDRQGNLKRRLTGPCYFDGNDGNGHPLPLGVYMVVSETGRSIELTIVR